MLLYVIQWLVTGSITVRGIDDFKAGLGKHRRALQLLELHDDPLIFEESPFFLQLRLSGPFGMAPLLLSSAELSFYEIQHVAAS